MFLIHSYSWFWRISIDAVVGRCLHMLDMSQWLSEVYNVNDTFKSGRWMCSYFVFWRPGRLSQNQKWEIICLRWSHTKEKCQQIHVRTEKIAFRTYAVCGTSLSLEAGGEGRGGSVLPDPTVAPGKNHHWSSLFEKAKCRKTDWLLGVSIE